MGLYSHLSAKAHNNTAHHYLFYTHALNIFWHEQELIIHISASQAPDSHTQIFPLADLVGVFKKNI